MAKKKAAKPTTTTIFQFKITLLESKPPIWRRIQVPERTLDQLHEHIQTVMGWTNSHLHEFEIGGERYGDPDLLGDEFEEFDGENSRVVRISQVVGRRRKGFRFSYLYDFGDGWRHGVLFEGTVAAEPKTKYPVCVDGQRACPPEDSGGPWGYAGLLEALADPKHEEHDSMREWAGDYDPDGFSTTDATRLMRRGLPDWRD